MNGTGVVDETTTTHIVLNRDGSTTATTATVYADGSAKGGSTVTTSADGHTVATVSDDGPTKTVQTVAGAKVTQTTSTVPDADGSYSWTRTNAGGAVTTSATRSRSSAARPR